MQRGTAASGAASTSDDCPFGLDLSTAVFDRAARLAHSLMPSAGASVILVHEGEIWRSRYAQSLPPTDPFVETVLKGGDLCWIEDGLADPRYRDHPLVKGPPFLRFTVAVPIRLPDGSTPGVLSLSSQAPQPFDAACAERLEDIADFLADEWSRAIAVATLARSLHERDQALERSERSEARLNLALSLSGVHVWELDFQHRALFKAGAEDTFFCKPQTFKGLYRDIFETIDPRDRAMVSKEWAEHIANGKSYRPEYRINRPDGQEVWAIASAELLLDETGAPARLVGAMQNVTERKQNEQALRDAKDEADAANRTKSAFLATMSHELRTPLNAILGFSELIAEQLMGPAPATYVDYAKDIHSSGHHLLELVNDVLDISKLEAGKFDLNESTFGLDELLKDVASSFRTQAAAAGLALHLDSALQGRICADRRLVKQVLLNLLSNALKFTKDGGSVTLAARRTGARVLEISVTDTGIGMTAREAEIAQTPFGQIDSSVARRFKGTGLGLPIAKSLVKLHGGDLAVASEPGVGTTVTVTLPASRLARDVAVC